MLAMDGVHDAGIEPLPVMPGVVMLNEEFPFAFPKPVGHASEGFRKVQGPVHPGDLDIVKLRLRRIDHGPARGDQLPVIVCVIVSDVNGVIHPLTSSGFCRPCRRVLYSSREQARPRWPLYPSPHPSGTGQADSVLAAGNSGRAPGERHHFRLSFA